MARGHRQKYWMCHGKDRKGEACGYMVPCGKTFCNSCGHEPPLHVSCPPKVTAGKGGGKGAQGTGNAGKSLAGDRPAAEVLRKAMEAKAAAEAKCKEMASEIAKMRQGQAAASGHCGAASTDAISEEMAAATKRIKAAEKTVKGLKDIDVDVRSGLGRRGAALLPEATHRSGQSKRRRQRALELHEKLCVHHLLGCVDVAELPVCQTRGPVA